MSRLVRPRSASGSVGRRAGSLHRPRVRCGRNPRVSGSKPAATAARSQACCNRRTAGGIGDADPRALAARPRSGNSRVRPRAPRPRDSLAAPARERARARPARRGARSPRNRSVRWIAFGAYPARRPGTDAVQVSDQLRQPGAHRRRRAPAPRTPGCSVSPASAVTARPIRAARAAASPARPGWPGSARARASPGKWMRRVRSPAAPAVAMKTRPTGFSAVPPSGPAMPVMATADVGPRGPARPRGHGRAPSPPTPRPRRPAGRGPRPAARPSIGCCTSRTRARGRRWRPGTEVRRAASRPPVQDSATARVRPRSRRRPATTSGSSRPSSL